MMRLAQAYKSKIMPELKNELSIQNDHAVPKIQKIVINAGIGKALQNNPKSLDAIVDALRSITGQQPVVTKAKKAIAGFKTRQGQNVGLAVTLRGQRMYAFLDKLVNIVFPRTRDFRGLSRSGFDGRGNYNCGLKEQIVFPELGETGAEGSFGLQVTIATTAKNNDAGYLLLKKFGFPFKD